MTSRAPLSPSEIARRAELAQARAIVPSGAGGYQPAFIDKPIGEPPHQGSGGRPPTPAHAGCANDCTHPAHRPAQPVVTEQPMASDPDQTAARGRGASRPTSDWGTDTVSWFDLSTVMHRRGDAEATRIAVQRSDITIRFGRELIGQLGWSRGDKVTVIVGRDEHFGLVRLAKGQSGWTLQHPGGSSKHGKDALVKLGRMIHGQPALPDLPERLPATPVETTVDAGMVEFRLPWLASGEQPIPERAAVDDPETKPPEAHGEAVDGAGSSSETNARQSGPADGRRSGARGEEDGQTRASAEDAGGNPATERVGPPTPRSIPGLPGQQQDQVQSRSLAEVETAPATRDPSPRDNPDEKGAFGRMSAAQTEEFVRAVAAGASRRELEAIADKLPARYGPGTINYLKEKLAHRIAAALPKAAPPPPPAPVTRVTSAPAEPDAAEHPTGPPPIPETTLKFLREEIVPVMASLGHKVTLSDDKTQIYLQEKDAPAKGRVTADALVARVNALLELEHEEALTLPSAA